MVWARKSISPKITASRNAVRIKTGLDMAEASLLLRVRGATGSGGRQYTDQRRKVQNADHCQRAREPGEHDRLRSLSNPSFRKLASRAQTLRVLQSYSQRRSPGNTRPRGRRWSVRTPVSTENPGHRPGHRIGRSPGTAHRFVR